MITIKGIKITIELHYKTKVYSVIAGLYQLFLGLIWTSGIIVPHQSMKLKECGKIINKALSEDYMKIIEKPDISSDEIRKRIEQTIGDAPRDIYA